MVRPKLPDTERRSEVLQIRLTKQERELLDRAAADRGVLVTDLIRDAALRRAKAPPKRGAH